MIATDSYIELVQVYKFFFVFQTLPTWQKWNLWKDRRRRPYEQQRAMENIRRNEEELAPTCTCTPASVGFALY